MIELSASCQLRRCSPHTRPTHSFNTPLLPCSFRPPRYYTCVSRPSPRQRADAHTGSTSGISLEALLDFCTCTHPSPSFVHPSHTLQPLVSNSQTSRACHAERQINTIQMHYRQPGDMACQSRDGTTSKCEDRHERAVGKIRMLLLVRCCSSRCGTSSNPVAMACAVLRPLSLLAGSARRLVASDLVLEGCAVLVCALPLRA